MTRRAARIVISGLVQGVGFRYFCRRKATEAGLRGWAKNRPDGSVEVWAEGDADLLESFISELRNGPPNARVISADISYGECTGKFDGFDIAH